MTGISNERLRSLRCARQAVTFSAMRISRAALILFFGLGFAVLAPAAPAKADFRFCNGTASRVGVAIGYKDDDEWVTEGWWNIEPGDCRSVLVGPLASRYYYVHAVDYDQGGEWNGEALMCTRNTSFTIRGVGRCEQRGYTSSGFYEVDTEENPSFTVQLLDDDKQEDGR